MYLNEIISVYCTDTDKTNKARVVRMHPKGIDVELNDIILRFNKTKPNMYICNYSGLEFVIKT
tara:strand:+ start:12 stop:200 length:189 start_codon:yes stop_codon:yes gene_type:complete